MRPASDIPSKTAFADRVLARDDLSAGARKQITRLRDEWAADPQTVVRRVNVCKRLDCKPTHERDLEREGKLDSFLDRNTRLIHVSSIYEHLIRQALASHPPDQPARKATGSPNIADVRALLPGSQPRPPESPAT
jgi:hypothetical protein